MIADPEPESSSMPIFKFDVFTKNPIVNLDDTNQLKTLVDNYELPHHLGSVSEMIHIQNLLNGGADDPNFNKFLFTFTDKPPKGYPYDEGAFINNVIDRQNLPIEVFVYDGILYRWYDEESPLIPNTAARVRVMKIETMKMTHADAMDAAETSLRAVSNRFVKCHKDYHINHDRNNIIITDHDTIKSIHYFVNTGYMTIAPISIPNSIGYLNESFIFQSNVLTKMNFIHKQSNENCYTVLHIVTYYKGYGD